MYNTHMKPAKYSTTTPVSPHGAKGNRGPVAGPQNKEALINAAREEFTNNGALVPLSRIAKRAGVGQGSLYRHFSDRVDLATAVFEKNLRDAEVAVGNSEKPYSTFLAILAEQAAEASVIIELVSSAEVGERTYLLRNQVKALVAKVYDSARDAGEIAAHVESRDLLTAVSMLALPLAKALPEDRRDTGDRIRKMLDAWMLSK